MPEIALTSLMVVKQLPDAGFRFDEAQLRVSYAGSTVTDASDAEGWAFDDSGVIDGTDGGTNAVMRRWLKLVKLNFSPVLRATVVDE